MKEVKFRWVDRYLIHLTISEKFLITFWCPLVFIAFLGGPKAEINFAPLMTRRLTITGSTLRP